LAKTAEIHHQYPVGVGFGCLHCIGLFKLFGPNDGYETANPNIT
jgi:hypothetical protein